MDISYPPGSIVWVKLEGGRWWPGEVTDDPASSEATKGLRKPPLAVVKFFDEDCFHVVKSEQHIYPYDCDKKDEFLNRGKDFKMSGKDNFSLQLKFEADVSKAESLCKPSTNKLTSTPTNSTVIAALRGAKYASYMKIPPAERFDYGENSEEKEIDWQPFVPRSEVGSARIRQQPATPKAKETMYSCDTCNFQTTRMDNFIRHHKSHSDPYRFHPGVETEPRYVYDKLKVKARKRVKDGTKGKKRTKKTDEDKKKINVAPKKRKSEEKERRVSSKKRKLTKDKTPFSNPFEEEEEEKKKEKEVTTNDNDDDDDDDDDDMDDIDAETEKLLLETEPPPAVEWEEFIKGSSTKSSNTQESDECKKMEVEDDENDVVAMKETSSSSTYPLEENDLSVEQNENGMNFDEHNDTDSRVQQRDKDSSIEKKENDLNIEPKENDLDVAIKENDLDVELKENDLNVEMKENDLNVELKENELDVELKENVLDVELKENDLDVELKDENEFKDQKELEIERVATPIESQNGFESVETKDKDDVSLTNEKEVIEEEIFSVPILPIEEISVQEEVTSEVIVEEAEIPSEEIVVTEASLHAGEMMVGEEIEVQEIEIQSDGLTGNEIVLGDEVVMHLLPEDRADGDVLLDPMVPQTNDQHIGGVLVEGDSGSIFSPVYASDHSLMAAAPVNKRANSTSQSDVYMEKECREHEESVQVSQAIDPDMNS